MSCSLVEGLPVRTAALPSDEASPGPLGMGNKSRITGLIAVASLAAALAILWPVVGAASPKVTGASSTYTDASGDNTNDGPDVTTVTVSDDASGTISFAATIGNRSALTDVDAVQAYFDTDKNGATGSGGYDYEVAWIQGQQLFMHWDGSQFSTQQSSTFTSAYKDGKATFSVDKADLGGSTEFNFIITTTGDTGDSMSDRAPDGSAVWTYPTGSGSGTPPPPPSPGSPPPPGSPQPPPSPTGTLKATKFTVGAAHAGKRFTVSMNVSVTSTGIGVKTKVACSAKIAGRAVPVKAKGSVQSGHASCVWTLPKNTKGKQLKGSITATYQGAKISRSFSKRVLA